MKNQEEIEAEEMEKHRIHKGLEDGDRHARARREQIHHNTYLTRAREEKEEQNYYHMFGTCNNIEEEVSKHPISDAIFTQELHEYLLNNQESVKDGLGISPLSHRFPTHRDRYIRALFIRCRSQAKYDKWHNQISNHRIYLTWEIREMLGLPKFKHYRRRKTK